MTTTTEQVLHKLQAYYYACGRNDESGNTWMDPELFADSYRDHGYNLGCSVQSWWARWVGRQK